MTNKNARMAAERDHSFSPEENTTIHQTPSQLFSKVVLYFFAPALTAAFVTLPPALSALTTDLMTPT
jgi:hypothetical protein